MIQRALMAYCVCSMVACGTASEKTPSAADGLALMLTGNWVPDDPKQIDFMALPRLGKCDSVVVNDVRDQDGHRVNQHNYLAFYDGKYWAMWSDGPGEARAEPGQHRNRVPGHDRAGQVVKYSTSPDGLTWSTPSTITEDPAEGWGWIARGFWIRDGKMLALITKYKAPGYAGEGLSLLAYDWNAESGSWKSIGVVKNNSMNNFPPAKLPSGEWMMTRRDSLQDVYFMYGGVDSLTSWETAPVAKYKSDDFRPEEPYWWTLPDNKTLLALFRDNSKGGFLFRATSSDNGRTWSTPQRTNFPDATSKFSGTRLKDGRYVLVSNPNPKKRDPMTIAVSDDGISFNKMIYLVGNRHIDYPHVMEHDGYIFVAFASAKQTMEVIRIPLEELDKVKMPTSPVVAN